MFTGLIEATGTVADLTPAASGRTLTIETPLGTELQPGNSVAVNGVCLTVATADAAGFSAHVSPETLRVTTLGEFREGRTVNLERPLRASDRLGGHFVLGHVDGVGRIRALRQDGECHWLDVEVPAALGPLLISKGSIAVDGISLTIAQLQQDAVSIQIVPFTWAHTSLSQARAGGAVNIEVDVLGKYVARLVAGQAVAVASPAKPAGVS